MNAKYRDITPVMTYANTPAPYIVSASDSNIQGYKAFDNNKETYYRSGIGFTTGTLRIYLGKAVICNAYSVANYYIAGYSMKNWTFEGSNDATNWTVLHTVTNKTSWKIDETYTYEFDNDTAYKYYRINCTAKNGTNSIVLSEVKLYQSVISRMMIAKVQETIQNNELFQKCITKYEIEEE